MQKKQIHNPSQEITQLLQKIKLEDQIPQQIAPFFKSFSSEEPTNSIHTSHWKQILNIILNLIQKHPQIYQDYTNNQKQNIAQYIHKTIKYFTQKANRQQIYDYLVYKLSADTDIPSQLLLLDLMVQLSFDSSVKVSWERQLPLELKTAGLVLHKYLTIKKQKSSGSTDKLPGDIILQKNCQRWIEIVLLSSLNKYKNKLNNHNVFRRYFINFGCDFAEALLQAFLESELNKDVLTTLLFQTSKIFVQQFCLNEMSSVFCETLHKNKMITPIKPIEIVEVYTPELLINPSGFNYLCKNILCQQQINYIYTQETVLRGLIPILGQSIKRQLPIKHDILQLAQKIILQTNLRTNSDNQFGYPISLLITNLITSKENESKFTNEKIDKILNVILNWKWSLNRCLQFSSKVQIKKFVLQQIDSSNMSDSYFILNTLNPLDSEKEFTDLYLSTLVKLQAKQKEYPWVSNLLKEKKSFKIVEQAFKSL